jgi:hypothetical protein
MTMGCDEPEIIEIHAKVAGVTHDNRRGRIKSRQIIISSFCQDGSDLEIRPEPDNPHSASALGVWVQSPGGRFSRGKSYQIGYVHEGDAEQINEWLRKGWTIAAQIWKVVGGEDGLNYGLRINIYLYPPGWVEHSVGDADGKAKPVQERKQWRLPSLPATTTKKMMTWGSLGMSRGLGLIALGLPVGWILGRPSDILGLGIVMTAVGAGLWGVGLTFSMQGPKEEGPLNRSESPASVDESDTRGNHPAVS